MDIMHYSEVCWLRKAKVQQCFLSILEEIKGFHTEKGQPVSYFEKCEFGM
jgi:hypothetical protein